MPSSKPTFNLLRWLIPRLSLPLFVLNGWALLLLIDYFKTPLTILIVGAVIAFLLNHPLQWLQRRGVQRGLAILILVAGVLILLGILGITLLPLLSQQAQELVTNFPTWEQSANQQIQALHDQLQSLGIPVNLNGVADNLSGQLSQQLQAIAARIPRWIEGAIGGVFALFLIIVVIVYLLLKGDSLWNGILVWLPIKLGRRLQTALPRSFRNYFIGQGTVALILGTVLVIAFTVFRIPYGFLFGVFIGTLALFPYGGTMGITLVTLLLALKSIGLGLTVLVIATVADQVVENGIAPRLMGHLTGVHPVWVVMAILVGAKIAGLLGVVLAVPISSTIKDVMEIYKPKRILEMDL
jgi:predicted PurR-regulated permease PerM